MNKTTATAIALLAALVAVAAPIAFALYQSYEQALDAQMRRASNYADDVLRRSNETVDQISTAFGRLREADRGNPCSDANVALMREIDLASSYIQAIGFERDGVMQCSSLGRTDSDLALGPIDVISPASVTTRLNVTFPFAPGHTFIVSGLHGYVAIIHKHLPIDATTGSDDVSLATVMRERWLVATSRGPVKPTWIDALRDGSDRIVIDDGYIVALRSSSKYYIGAMAAVPYAYVAQSTRALAMWLVPIGLAAGIALALAVLYLARSQMAMPTVIRTALRRDEFFVVYQPIVDLRTGSWIGAEALIRWRRPNGELVRPDLFIPVAEDSGLIHRITERVIELIGRDCAGIFVRHPNFHIGINLSSVDLHTMDVVEWLRGLKRAARARPNNLLVEATERGFVNASVARGVIAAIRVEGVQVAIDDFGTGYSSLSHLQSLELDYLKIDKSFVDTIGTGAAAGQVVPHIIEMAKSLDLMMIAEGIETEAQATYLRDHGVQYGQGWLFARPMPYADLIAQLDLSSAEPAVAAVTAPAA
ncbi:MAG: EAL domain-containing protein [Alphaproteobacteria bacterium]